VPVAIRAGDVLATGAELGDAKCVSDRAQRDKHLNSPIGLLAKSLELKPLIPQSLFLIDCVEGHAGDACDVSDLRRLLERI
jgi:hypothetical protein